MNLKNGLQLQSIFLSILLLCSACSVEQLFPELVADGAGRLGTATAAVLVQVLNTNENCGFQNPTVLNNGILSYDTPNYGTITYQVPTCTLDFGEGTVVSEDCKGNKTTLKGKVTLSAKQVRRGHIVNYVYEDQNPTHISSSLDNSYQFVIPDGDDSVEIELSQVQFSQFEMHLSSIDKSIRISSGSISANIVVHLAESQKFIDLCSQPTPNLTIRNLRFHNASVKLPGIFGQFEVPIHASDIRAQLGTWKNETNTFKGNMLIWDRFMPVNNDLQGLVPQYNEQEFIDGFLCGETKEQVGYPFKYDCNFNRLLAVNAARLVVMNFATIAQESFSEIIDKSVFNSCGFNTFGTKTSPSIVSGQVGESGLLQLQIHNCLIGTTHSKIPYLYDRNCFKETNLDGAPNSKHVKTYVQGTALISSGTMDIQGERNKTLVVFDSVTPTSPTSLSFKYSNVRLSNFSTFTLEGANLIPSGRIVFENGILSGQVNPIFSENKNTPCVFQSPTPLAEFKNIQLHDSKAIFLIHFDNKILQIPIHINSTKLYAQNGIYQSVGNYIWGNISINGKVFELSKPRLENGTPIQVPLNPGYDQEEFDAAYACRDNLAYVIPHDVYINTCQDAD